MNNSLALKRRDSNLELYRCIVMVLIIAHHYVANSGLMDMIYANPMAGTSVFLTLFAAWGKPGINCFLLITGYFMCKTDISLKKYVKLLLEIYFYRTVLYIVFLITGYEPFSIKTLAKAVLLFKDLGSNFIGCYMLFFLLIPFLNILLRNLSQRMHLLLVMLCLFIYTGVGALGGLPYFTIKINYISWFSVLYILAAYIRFYPNRIMEKTSLWCWVTAGVMVLSAVSIVVCAWLGDRLDYPKLIYYAVSDSNKPLALALGVASFLMFKNIKVPYSPVINAFGASAFGALLLHANGDTMRRWLWVDLLKNTQMYHSALLPVHAIVSVLVIYLVCSMIDMLRIRFFEKPFFRWWDKQYPRFFAWYEQKQAAILQKLHIQK